MKALTKRMLAAAVRNDRCWRILDFLFFRIARLAEDERNEWLFDRRVAAIVHQTFPDLTVRTGPFQGMRYPGTDAICSALLPKLLGSYESELHAVVEKECQKRFDKILDVGCAEGFYAVGLAMRIPTATVHAFDIDPHAIALCGDMAKLNGVSDRVLTHGICTSSELQHHVAKIRAFVVCDCEGFELTLFDEAAISALSQSDVLIELHDFYGTDIFRPLTERFQRSHHIEVVESIDDDRKTQDFVYPQISQCSRTDRKFILAERRPVIMRWLFLTPITSVVS